MKFMDPTILYLLWAVIPVAALMVFGIRQRKKILALFADPGAYPFLLPGSYPNIRWIKCFLVLGALILAVFALAGPQAGFRWEKTHQKGVDIMIALDCSNSMLAQDIKPNRLEQAKREIIDLIRLMKSDRAGLVAFAGQAILQCPLTLDHETFNIFLRVLTPDYLPVGGTNLAAAMETCYSGFEKGSDTDKAIVLITDGENTAGGETEEIARKMAAEGIKVFCIGVGDPAGAPIPDAAGGFKKDGQGNIILSRADDKGLEKIAALTSGRYVRSVAGNMDLDQIYTQDILNTMERKTLTQGKKKVWEQRFQWFLFPCILLLFIEMILPLKKKSASIGLVLLVLALGMGIRVTPAEAALFSSHVKKGLAAYESNHFDQAKTHFIDAQLQSPDDLRHYYNIGAAAYMNKEYEQAEKNFAQAAASSDPDLRHKAMYNLANTRYRLGKLPQAIADYEAILTAFPDDRQARENLEFVKQKQEEEKQQKQKDSKENQDSKEDQKDQEEQKEKKDPGNQKNTDQGDQDSGQNQDPGNPESGNKDQDQEKQHPQDVSQEGQTRPDTDPQKDQNPSDEAMGKASEGKDDGDKQGQGQSALLENRLNRLEDKPGMGLVPVIQQQTIEKDW
ncbi:MAG: VWA domain-containing protein [Proteobacteria bacterium]|nr:VWA domain-containing protein [Pseudomonadota bacterium]